MNIKIKDIAEKNPHNFMWTNVCEGKGNHFKSAHSCFRMYLTASPLLFSSLYVLFVIRNILCEERIKVGPGADKEKKINPYITKFHQGANLRPTKCQGKQCCTS